jgi:hypothetical protein
MLRCVLAAAAVLGTLSAPASTQDQQADTAAVVADRLRSYLQELEPQLSALVAEERFEQAVTPIGGEGSSTQLTVRRVLVSEVGFVRLPDDHAWLGHRRVQSIDGRPVRTDAPGLRDLFTRSGAEQLAVARRISEENARHNLGHPRSTNVPTLPLDLLHPRHRAAYAVSGGNRETRDGVRVARLDFAEGLKGEVVAYDSRSFVRTVVRAWVEVETGALQRAEVTLIPPVAARENHVVRVDYEMNGQFRLRVPIRLSERFWAGGTGEGKATYRNYRRFETAARIVPPQ